MRLLDRYLLRELLLPLSFCLVGFLVFWSALELIGDLADLQKAKLRGLEVVEYCLMLAPEKMAILLPVALLLALLYALTQHTRHNEITAMRAAGISLWRLSGPYLALGLTLSFALLAINELAVPHASAAVEEIKTRYTRSAQEKRLVRNLLVENARGNRRWHIGAFDLETAEMSNATVMRRVEGGLLSQLHASRALYTNGAWALFEVQELRGISPTDNTLAPHMQTNFLFASDLTETPDQIRSELKVSAGLAIKKLKRAEIPVADLLEYLHLHPRPRDAARLYTMLHGRLAAPWTCLVVVLIALPFGAMTGRRNVFVGVAGSIFIFFAFYAISMLGLALGTGGLLPAWLAAWLPNLVFSAIAIFLTTRVR